MARFADEEVERLKREVSLEQLVRARGVELERRGADLHGRCPFHDDRTPSFVVTPAKNLWHCLGACQAGGSVIDWVMRVEGVSFRHAVELLRTGYAMTGTAPAPVKHSTVPKLESPIAASGEAAEVLARVVGYYHETLLESEEALGYLERRGLGDRALVEHFRLGLREPHARLPAAEGKPRERGGAAGTAARAGHPSGVGARALQRVDRRADLRRGRRSGRDLRTQDQGATAGGDAGAPVSAGAAPGRVELGGAEGLARGHPVRGTLRRDEFLGGGYRNVTAVYGVEGLTADHLDAFRRHGTRRVLLAYDRDEAGERAAERHSELFGREGIECFRIQFPRDSDANEVAVSAESASVALGQAIRRAVWIGAGSAPTREEAHEVPHLLAAPSPEARHAEPPAASPVPEAAPLEVPCELVGEDVLIRLGDRLYRVRGLQQNQAPNQMRVQVRVLRGADLHSDTLDLAVDRNRQAFAKRAADELMVKEAVISRDLALVHYKLEELQEHWLAEAEHRARSPVETMTEAERAPAMELLRDPSLLDRVLEDFERCGVVGEETNKLRRLSGRHLAQARTSRWRVLIQSSSAAGKTSLMEAVLAFVPEEERVKYSAMTGQSLFYMAETDLRHKVLAIVEEEGAQSASYALKLLQLGGRAGDRLDGQGPADGAARDAGVPR